MPSLSVADAVQKMLKRGGRLFRPQAPRPRGPEGAVHFHFLVVRAEVELRRQLRHPQRGGLVLPCVHGRALLLRNSTKPSASYFLSSASSSPLTATAFSPLTVIPSEMPNRLRMRSMRPASLVFQYIVSPRPCGASARRRAARRGRPRPPCSRSGGTGATWPCMPCRASS